MKNVCLEEVSAFLSQLDRKKNFSSFLSVSLGFSPRPRQSKAEEKLTLIFFALIFYETNNFAYFRTWMFALKTRESEEKFFFRHHLAFHVDEAYAKELLKLN